MSWRGIGGRLSRVGEGGKALGFRATHCLDGSVIGSDQGAARDSCWTTAAGSAERSFLGRR